MLMKLTSGGPHYCIRGFDYSLLTIYFGIIGSFPVLVSLYHFKNVTQANNEGLALFSKTFCR